jgi:flagellar hook protein FlgE
VAGGDVGPLQLPVTGVDLAVTSRVDMQLNLDARAEVRGPGFDGTLDTYNNATSLTVYDQLGQPVALTYFFQKAEVDPVADTNTWNVYATANGEEVNGGDPVVEMTFGRTGANPTLVPANPTLDVPRTASSLDLPGVTLDMGAITQYGTAFGVTNMSQDGNAPGQLSGVVVEGDGTVTARFSNGESRTYGQVELATFRNPQGLQPLGGNVWARTAASGDPTQSAPGSANLGVLQAGALEESNVDLTGELVSMITAQRVYQANAQTIKTQDQVLQTLVNLR